MTESELYWLAGWLEGEGCFLVTAKRTTLTFKIVGTSTDEDVAARVAQLLHTTLKSRRPSGLGKKTRFDVSLNRTSEVIALCRQLLPLMGKRRSEKITAMLATFEAYQPLTRRECTDRAQASKAQRLKPQMEASAKQIESLRHAGLTWQAIAKLVGISDSAAQNRVYRHSGTYVRDIPAQIKNRSKTHCAYGHPFTGENLERQTRNGRTIRQCRTCRRRRGRDYMRRKRAA